MIYVANSSLVFLLDSADVPTELTLAVNKIPSIFCDSVIYSDKNGKSFVCFRFIISCSRFAEMFFKHSKHCLKFFYYGKYKKEKK